MKIETALPYSWLRTLSPSIKDLDAAPLWGAPPPFPWDEFSEHLSKALHINDMHMKARDVSWKSPEEIQTGLGQNPVCLAFHVTPFHGTAYCLIARQNVKALLDQAIGKEEALTLFKGSDFEKEFTHFLALESALAFQKINFDKALTPQLTDKNELPKEPCLCIDVDMSTPVNTLTVRLAISSEMRKAIAERFAQKTLQYPAELSEMALVEAHLVAGSTSISKAEWANASPGDFLLLDSCTYIPGEDKGRVLLTVNNTPLFRVKVKEGNIKLLEYPVLQEVQTSMANPKDADFEEDFETEDNLTNESETFEGETEEDASSEFSDTEEFEDEDSAINKAPLPSARPQPSSKTAAAKPTQAATAPMTKPDDIPLTISVEVGRIQMSLQKLMELQPGNVLELDVQPENGVDLVVNGRCVGKGELLKLGDTLGVRILDKA